MATLFKCRKSSWPNLGQKNFGSALSCISHVNVVLNGVSFCEKQTVLEQITYELSLVFIAKLVVAANFVFGLAKTVACARRHPFSD